MSDWLPVLWTILVVTIHVLAAAGVTAHAILRSRQSKAAVAWIGLAWTAPVIGGLAYLCLGINRIERKAGGLGLEEVRRNAPGYQPPSENTAEMQEIIRNAPALAGLVQLGTVVTGRPLLSGNRIDPLRNGDEAFPAMLEAIEAAQGSVALMTYIFDSDQSGELFLEALVRACQRGVLVRVLIDHVGSRYSKVDMVRRLRDAGVMAAAFLPPGKVGWFRFANLRNHRKILVVDGEVGFTGGTNIRESHCLALQTDTPVQCLHFRLAGPVVAHLQEAFAVDWEFTTTERLEGDSWFRAVESQGLVAARGISDGPDSDIDKMQQILLGALATATERVRIVTPYFLPDDVLRWALAVAAMRKVEIEIVIPERNNIRVMDWAILPQLPFLLEKGCKVYLAPAPFDHSKLMVVDGIWSLIGSTNWDARSLRLNFEYNIECYDPDLAARLDAIIDDKLGRARRVTREDLSRRPIPVRLRDGLAHLLAPYL